MSSTSALAATTTASITVSATVVAACSVGGTAVAFGAHPQGAASVTQQAALTVNCSPGTAYQVSLNNGLAGDSSSRRLSGPGGGTLPYDLYRDAARSQRWSEGSSAAVGVGSGDAQVLPVYAATGPFVADAGTYSDTVTATLTY